MQGGKPCRLCEKKRWGTSSWCFSHFREREKKKREEKAEKKLLRKTSSKKFQQSELKKWKKKCWKAVSEWVRRGWANQDGLVACYTCPVIKPWKEMQAGHFHHRTLNYDDRNLKPQCAQCNMKEAYGGKSGNLAVYGLRLTKENGIEWMERLQQDATRPNIYSIEDLKRIHADLVEKLSHLSPPTQ